ncbi:MAG: 1-acyl-sn-glycerol-3-phosphate acyltransferase [Polyangiaceae bacterium]
MRRQDRERAQIEAATRVVDRIVAKAKNQDDLEAVLSDTLYWERQRLERERKDKPRIKADIAFYQDMSRRMRHAAEHDQRALLDRIARRFAGEIVGSFDDRVYRVSTTAVPALLGLMLGATTPGRLRSLATMRRGLSDHVEVQGAIDRLKRLGKLGTLIVVPTHSSHLDSLVLGYAVHLLGMPPLLYGAGLNLFENPVLSYFMNNLGAYRVDRKKKDSLYKDVLKEYATVALEFGYDNLFFPGGTRSRSGMVEQHLKRGLLGTGIRAFVNNLRAGKDKPNMYVVPCTISYKLVLEAETLIDDYLKEVGKSRYIIEDDEFSRPRRVLEFMKELASLDARVVITFGEPLDLVGNPVDDEGRSLDPRGRIVDARSYVMVDGEPEHDAQRDAEFTNELSREIAIEFLRHNVVMSTHLVGLASTRLLTRKNPDVDQYRLLRTGGSSPCFTLEEICKEIEVVRDAISTLPAGPRLSHELSSSSPLPILEDSLKAYGCYHARPALERRGDRVFHEDRNLLLYYGNRLRGYDLGRALGAN